MKTYPKAKPEPVGTTHIRRRWGEETLEDRDLNVVRVSLGVQDGFAVWLCIYGDGSLKVDVDPGQWSGGDEWELL